MTIGVTDDIVNPRTGILPGAQPMSNIPVQGMAFSSITPTTMCYFIFKNNLDLQ